MAAGSFQAKLLYLIIAVLLLMQMATLVSVHLAGQSALRKSTTEGLRVGARVLDRILATRARRLADNLRVLALDFAFREAIASADVPTITSVLANHGSRISADAVILIALDGIVTADTLGGRLAGKPFPYPSLLRMPEERGEASATVSFSNRPYQFVIVPVLAPRPIAWVCAGFEIDESVLTDVRRLTSLDVSLWSSSAGQNPQIISTLTSDRRNDLVSQLTSLSMSSKRSETTMRLDNAAYATLFQPLSTADNSRVQTFLQRSLDEARKPFVNLELQIFTLSSIALMAAVVAATFFARTVTKPLRILADGAARIASGDYVTPIEIEQKDEIGHLAMAFNDMQSSIAAREDEITHQAAHDALTGLPNRSFFIDRLSQSIALAKHSSDRVGIIMMDVNRFKEINDTLGHLFGDQLLIEIGRRIALTFEERDAVARLGGDEFAVMFTAGQESQATEVAERISAALETPFVLRDLSIDVVASMGIAFYPTHADDAGTLMKRADIAMYEAKKSKRPYEVYEAGRDEHSLRRLSLTMDLRQAVANDELEIHYQPKIHMNDDRAVHAEALVRWNHAKHGQMRPDEFIPLAEQSGNITLITRWVLRKAISQCAEWNSNGMDLTVSVNLSALDLFDSDLPVFVSGLLTEAGLSPERLVLELTESAVMKDPAYALRILGDLRARGVKLAIDDFGTGYSSLAYLKRLPVGELKIDKSFVLNLSAVSADDLVIVRSTIDLGHNMGMVVVAEGVETQESWGLLKDFGCDMAQGYLISRPVPADEFRKWLEARQGRAAARTCSPANT